MTSPVIASYRDQFDAISSNASLSELRRRAFDRFAALGFPTTRDEDWHYTPVTPIAETPFVIPRSPDAVAQRAPVRLGTGPLLVFVDGRFSASLSVPGAGIAGLEVRTLNDALSADASFVEAQLASLATFERSPFTALNTAFATDGVVIRVARNAEIAQPIEIAWIATGAAGGALISPRMLIDVGAGAKVTIIESFSGASGIAYFTNAVSELRMGDGARVDVFKVQEESTAAYHVGTLQTSQGRDSIFHSFSYATGARLSRTNIYTTMASTGAEARLNGLYLLDGEQHCDHQTFVHHAAEACASRELYKGILDGSSHGVFNGKVLVDPIAQKTDGKQTNHALLLSEHARVDTKPQLEIFADDVKCTHGATVGRLDDTALFYLKSRGINHDTARALLTYAFAAGVLETIDFAPLRDSLERLAFARYHDASVT